MYNGQITEEGTYDDLMQHNGPFAQFLQAYLMKDDTEEEKPDAESKFILICILYINESLNSYNNFSRFIFLY